MIDIVLITTLVIILCFNIYYYICACKNDDISEPKNVTGTRIPGIQLASKLGYPTINMELNEKTRCGFYSAESDFGDAIMIIGKRDPYRADVHFLKYDDKADKHHTINFTNLQRLVDERSDVITTFNAGCEA